MGDFAYEKRNDREAVWNADCASGSEAGKQPETLLALQMPVRKGNRCGGVALKKWTYKELRLLPQNGAAEEEPGFDRAPLRAPSGFGSCFRRRRVPGRLEVPV